MSGEAIIKSIYNSRWSLRLNGVIIEFFSAVDGAQKRKRGGRVLEPPSSQFSQVNTDVKSLFHFQQLILQSKLYANMLLNLGAWLVTRSDVKTKPSGKLSV